MLLNKFKINECNKYVYVKGTPSSYVIVCLYIDDMLIVKSNYDVIMITKIMLSKHF